MHFVDFIVINRWILKKTSPYRKKRKKYKKVKAIDPKRWMVT